MHKKILFTIFSLQLLTTNVFGHRDVQYWFSDNHCTYQCDYINEKFYNFDDKEDLAPINPCGTIYAGMDWLRWKIEQDNMEFGSIVTEDVVEGETVSVNVKADILRPKFEEHNGYRLYLDYETACKNWKFTAAYTHAPTSTNFTIADNPLSVSMDFISIFNTSLPILSLLAEASFSSIFDRWNANVNYIDLGISNKIVYNDWFTFRPDLGIRGFWSDQKIVLRGSSPDISFDADLKEKVEGIGLEASLWTDFALGCGFSISSRIGGALLYAKIRNHGTLSVTSDGEINISYNDSIQRALTMFDTFLGLRYAMDFSNITVDLHAGWEQHIVFDINQFSVDGGDNMTLQGFTLGGSIAF